eukprot:3056838-Rhodomonas_salina.1
MVLGHGRTHGHAGSDTVTRARSGGHGLGHAATVTRCAHGRPVRYPRPVWNRCALRPIRKSKKITVSVPLCTATWPSLRASGTGFRAVLRPA